MLAPKGEVSVTQVLVNQSVDKAVVKYPWRIARDQVQVNVLDGIYQFVKAGEFAVWDRISYKF